jgi:hypothetical protein
MPDLIKTPLAGPNVEALPFIQPNTEPKYGTLASLDRRKADILTKQP